MNRKAFNGDVSLLMVFVFVIGLVAVAGGRVMSRLNESLSGGPVSVEGVSMFAELTARYPLVFDGAVMLVFGLFAITLLVSTAALGSRPEFFFITVFVGMFFVGMAAVLSNVFGEFFSQMAVEGQFRFIPLLMNNLVEAVLLLLAMLVFGLFVKIRGVV